MNRLEQIVPAGIIAAIGLWVAFISFTQEPAAAFSFPRLISALFVVLALWVLAQAFLGKGEEAATISKREWLNLAPGLIVGLLYVFWLAKALGFYTATTLAVFVLISLYDPAPHGAISTWVKRLTITAGFMVVMYLLFAVLLGVFTPREVLFR